MTENDSQTGTPTVGEFLAEADQRCPVRPLTGDLSCVRNAGHRGLHRNFQGIEWRNPETTTASKWEPDRFDRCGEQRREHRGDNVRCTLPADHDGDHADKSGSRVAIWEADADPTPELELTDDEIRAVIRAHLILHPRAILETVDRIIRERQTP